MRFALSTYSLSAYAERGVLSQLGAIGKARELGFEAVEICEIWPHDGSDRLDYAKRLREECERLSMPVASYVTGADFLTCQDLPKELDRVFREVEIAKLLGAPKLRHDAAPEQPWGPQGPMSFDDCLPRLAVACRQVTEFAQELGVRTMVENHGQFCQDSDRVEKLVNAVNHQNFGLLCDIGNFVDADEDPAKACGRIAPYVIHVHVKDMHLKPGTEPYPGDGYYPTRGRNWGRGAIVGQGNVPVRQCLSILRTAGYDGDVVMEFEGLEDPAFACKVGLDYLQRYRRVSEIEY